MTDEMVGLYCRVRASVRDTLLENLRAAHESAQPGDGKITLGVLIERCVVATLAPAPEPDVGLEVAGRKGKRK